MNIGDKIRVVDCAENKHNGKLGKIVDFDTSGEPSLKVAFSNDRFDNEWFCAYELELIESTKKEVKEKYYPIKITVEIDGKKIELLI